MTAVETLPALLAGMVFFLIGLDSVKSSLKALASRSMRRRMQSATTSPVRAALLGLGIGAVGALVGAGRLQRRVGLPHLCVPHWPCGPWQRAWRQPPKARRWLPPPGQTSWRVNWPAVAAG